MKHLQHTWQKCVASALILLLLSLLLWALYPPTPMQFVTLDSKHITQHFAKQLSQSNLSKAQKNTLTDRFAEQLLAVSKAYARQHHVVILNKSAVMAGVPDVSFTIAARIKQQMEHD